MKKWLIFIAIIILMPCTVSAKSGCCSWHGGVAGCSGGRQVCNDGTLSPSCTCSGGTSSSASVSSQPTYIYGCTNSTAINYNNRANKDDGSCISPVYGCKDQTAINYKSDANTEDNSCEYKKEIVLTEKIKYEIKHQKSDELLKGKNEIKVTGKDGEKKVTYDAVVDKNGKVLTKNKIKEEFITRPVDQVIMEGTKESNNFVSLLWFASLIIVLIYAYKHREAPLIVNFIANKAGIPRIVLYVVYVLFIIPAFIDIILLITYLIKNNASNSKG